MLNRPVSKILILLFLVQMLTPLVGLFIFTIQGGGGNLSFANYSTLFQDSQFIGSLLSSLTLSLIAVGLSIVLWTLPIWHAYLFAPRLLTVIRAISYAPFVVPAVVLALAYVQFFNSGFLNLVGTPYLLPFAFALLGMPYYVEAVINRLRHVDARNLLDASRTLGANDFYSFLHVQIPLLRAGIINGSVLVFTISMGEFTITQLTTGGSLTTLPIYMMIVFTNNPLEGSAMAVIALIIATLGIVLGLITASGRKRRFRSLFIRKRTLKGDGAHAVYSQSQETIS